MRKNLAASNGDRKRFRATFSRIGKKVNFKGYSEDTILLTKVTDIETSQIVTDHIWFTFSKGFESVNLTEGLLIEFDARVVPYKKGYVNKQYKINHQKEDFKLSHPTRIKVFIEPVELKSNQ